jgi:MFS family permease
MSRNLILAAVLVAAVVSFFTIPLSGHTSDRIGRRKMYMIGAATVGVFGFVYFAMVDTAIPWVVFFAIVLSLIPHDMMYGPQAALIAEAFTPRLRYSGLTRLSVGLHHRRRAGSNHSDGPDRQVPLGLRHFRFYRRVRRHKPARDRFHA